MPLMASGYDCWPFLIPGTNLFRSAVKTRPSWSTFEGVTCVSGE